MPVEEVLLLCLGVLYGDGHSDRVDDVNSIGMAVETCTDAAYKKRIRLLTALQSLSELTWYVCIDISGI